MFKRSRMHPICWFVDPRTLRSIPSTQHLWYEAPTQLQERLWWARHKPRLLAWVRREMAARLTAREAHCLALYYFRGMTYREISISAAITPSSVYRTVQRSIVKLRRAARGQGGVRGVLRKGRTVSSERGDGIRPE